MTLMINNDALLGIGQPVIGGTVGSVLFIGAGGLLAEDNANFFWDDTNNRLGIGTTTPTQPFEIAQNLNGTLRARIDNANAGGEAQMQMLNDGDKIYSMGIKGSSNAAYFGIQSDEAYILMDSASTNLVVTTTGDIRFHTNSGTQALKIDTSQNVELPNDNAKLKFGAGQDASIYYDGTDMWVNSDEVGSGSLKIGDASNYTEVKPDGEVNLVGTARVLKHFYLPITGGAGANNPSVRVTEAPYLSWTFAVNDDTHHTLPAPHDMDYSQDVNVYVEWYTSVSQTDDEVNWQIQWNTRAIGETVNTGSTTDTSGDVNCPAQWVIADTLVETIPGGTISADDVLGIDLTRIAIVDGTNPQVGTIHVLSFHIEYCSNKLGEAT